MARTVRNLNWVHQHYGEFFQRFNIDAGNLDTQFTAWSSNSGNASVSDFLWSVFQQLLIANAKICETEEQLYSSNLEIYSQMWQFLVVVERNNGNPIARLRHLNQLRLWDVTTPFLLEVEMISSHCCSHCETLDGKRMPLGEAIKEPLLASDYCTKLTGCSCNYAAIGVRDENDKLIPILR